MKIAREALDRSPPKPFELDIADIWIDVDANGERDEGENASQLLGPLLFSNRQLREMQLNSDFSAVIRFDEADADWLAAYTHVFSAIANFALAFDPTTVVREMREQRALLENAPQIEYTFDENALTEEIASLERQAASLEAEIEALQESSDASSRALNTARRNLIQVQEDIRLTKLRLPIGSLDVERRDAWIQDFRPTADVAYVVIQTLRNPPEVNRIRSVRTHLLKMIDHNKAFWEKVALETDDDLEWIPNPNQRAALGIELPEETGPTWLAVLQDAEDVLNGHLLVRHPLLPQGMGVDVSAYFERPRDLDLVPWLHGTAVYEFAAEGPMITQRRWLQFTRLMNGRGGLFAVFLN